MDRFQEVTCKSPRPRNAQDMSFRHPYLFHLGFCLARKIDRQADPCILQRQPNTFRLSSLQATGSSNMTTIGTRASSIILLPCYDFDMAAPLR